MNDGPKSAFVVSPHQNRELDPKDLISVGVGLSTGDQLPST